MIMADPINTFDPIYHYDILGEINLKQVSYDSNNQRISLEMPMESIFYSDQLAKTYPHVVIGSSAFIIRLLDSNGRVSSSFIGIVETLTTYTISKVNGKSIVKLDFSYARLENDYRNPSIPVVPIVISDIITNGNFIALVLTGDVDAAVQEAKTKYHTFYHGGILYHSYKASRLNMAVNLSMLFLTIGVAVYACATELPNEKEKDEFDRIFDAKYSKILGGPRL